MCSEVMFSLKYFTFPVISIFFSSPASLLCLIDIKNKSVVSISPFFYNIRIVIFEHFFFVSSQLHYLFSRFYSLFCKQIRKSSFFLVFCIIFETSYFHPSCSVPHFILRCLSSLMLCRIPSVIPLC